MTKKKEYVPTPEDVAWRKGYDMGVQNALRTNDIAIKIGSAILDALDKRYQQHEEDY